MWRFYYYAGGTRVAEREATSGGETLYYLLGDHLGSTSLTADPLDGDKLSELRYKAWGETRYALTSLPADRRFTGQVEEAGIGLYYFNARWYDSSLGRWAQPDSIVPVASQGVQAWDRYAFVNNNSLRYTDPTGHKVADDTAGGCVLPGCEKKETEPPQVIKLPGWDPWYGQKQPDDQGCFPTATAAALSTFMGGQVSAAQIDIAMKRSIWKFQAFGVPPIFQDDAINALADQGMGSFSASYSQGTREDLIENLNQGMPTIVSISWGYTKPIGHALLVTAYNHENGNFTFFDPAHGEIDEESFVDRYGISFTEAWLDKQTIFIPSGSMVTISH